MKKTEVAVKAIVEKNGKVFLVQRQPDDPEQPSGWELPGGRINAGENPAEGLKREVKEETGIEVEPLTKINTRSFQRKDGVTVQMITFACVAKSEKVLLSAEHASCDWVPVEKAIKQVTPFYTKVLEEYTNIYLKK